MSVSTTGLRGGCSSSFASLMGVSPVACKGKKYEGRLLLQLCFSNEDITSDWHGGFLRDRYERVLLLLLDVTDEDSDDGCL